MKQDKGVKIIFVSTDNSASSGAFLSMMVLNEYLNKEFGIETEIILPKKGTGAFLLEERNIRYKVIRSYDWLVPIKIKNDLKTKCIFFVKRLLNIISIAGIRKELRKEKADIVHINTIYGYVGAIAAKKEKIPLVWHFREIIEKGHDKTFMDREFSQKILLYADATVAISKSVLRYYQTNDIEMNHPVVIYNGIDVPTFYDPEKNIFEKKKVSILYVGDFSHNKGAFNLLEAIELMDKDFVRNVIVTFVGRSNDEFDESIRKSPVKDIITIYPFQKNVADFYRKNDIVVTGAKYEAFGRVTAEAMLSGCLVITTDDSGSGELVTDRYSGYSYAYGDAKMLAGKIEYAIMHKEESGRIAKCGQQFIKENMNARQNAENIVKLYHTLIG